MEVNGATGELDEITRVDAGPTLLRDATEGVSISLAANWLSHRAEHGPVQPYFNAAIFDPEAKCQCAIWAGKIERDLRAEMQAKAEDRAKKFKNYKIRSDSWTPRQINGAEALSVIADFEETNRPMVEYLTLLKQGPKGMVLFARISAADLPVFRPQFDRIVDSARLQ